MRPPEVVHRIAGEGVSPGCNAPYDRAVWAVMTSTDRSRRRCV